MAKEAGRLFASEDYPELIKAAGISKEAWDSMSEMEKQALFGKLVKGLAGLGRKAVSRVGGAAKRVISRGPKAKPRISGRKSVEARRAAEAVAPTKAPMGPKTRAAAQQHYLQQNIQRAQAKGVQGAPTRKPSAPAPTPQPQAQVAPGPAAAPQPRTGPGYQRMQIQQTPQGMQASPMGAGGTAAPAAAPGRPGSVAQGPASRQMELPLQTGQAGQRPYAFEGGAATVAPGPAARAPAGGPSQAQMAQGWGSIPSKQVEVFGGAKKTVKPSAGELAPGPGKKGPTKAEMEAGWKGEQTPKQQKAQAKKERAAAAEEAARAAASERGPVEAGSGKPGTVTEPGKPTPGILPFMWRNRVPIAVAGGLAAGYGVMKGVPWAARQLEQTSQTPMAYGGGWSPVDYGYGSNPYGAGQGGHMGYGA